LAGSSSVVVCKRIFLTKEKTIMKPMKCVLFVVFLVLPALAWGEFYKYKDAEGNIHFTDDVSSIPSDQLPEMDQYEEADRRPVTKKPIKVKEEGSKKSSPETEEEGSGADLRERGARLDAEYEALMEEREQLNKATQEPLTKEGRKELADKIDAFNERLHDFEKRRQSFNKEVEEYNASLKKAPPSSEAEEE
jgi:hypothetical protein